MSKVAAVPWIERFPPTPRARVEHRVRSWIDRGRLAVGQEIPSETKLANELSVARGTVRSALKRLEAEGLLECSQGRTRRVKSGPPVALSRSLLSRVFVVLAPPVRDDPRHRQSGWSEWITQGVIQALRARSLHVLTLDPTEVRPAELSGLMQQTPAGVLVPEVFRGLCADPAAGLPLLSRLRDAGVPAVAYGGDPRLAPFNRVVSDHEAGAYALTRYLVQSGRRRPLMLIEQPGQTYWLTARRSGYERAMREAGLEPVPPLTMPPFPAEREPSAEFFDSVSRYVMGHLYEHLAGTQPVDAILAMSDGKVFPIARACELLGKRVHEDVAVVGYDNYWQDSWERAYTELSPLATIDKQNFEMGRQMVELLLDRADSDSIEAAQTRVVPPRLVLNS